MTRALAISLFVLMNLTATAQAAQQDWFNQEANTPLLLAGDAAQKTSKAQGKSTKTSASANQKEGENCEWACQRWGRNCSIDSRTGKYKCKRSCLKFGKTCE